MCENHYGGERGTKRCMFACHANCVKPLFFHPVFICCLWFPAFELTRLVMWLHSPLATRMTFCVWVWIQPGPRTNHIKRFNSQNQKRTLNWVKCFSSFLFYTSNSTYTLFDLVKLLCYYSSLLTLSFISFSADCSFLFCCSHSWSCVRLTNINLVTKKTVEVLDL